MNRHCPHSLPAEEGILGHYFIYSFDHKLSMRLWGKDSEQTGLISALMEPGEFSVEDKKQIISQKII